MALGIISERPSMLAAILDDDMAAFEEPPPVSNDHVHDLTAPELGDEHLGEHSTMDTLDVSLQSSHAKHNTPDTATDTENMQPVGDDGGGVEVVDISMWTRPISTPVSPIQTNLGVKVSSPDEHDPMNSNIPDHRDELARSESSENIEEIPFSNSPQANLAYMGSILQSDHPSETITVHHQNQQDSLNRYLPQSVNFLEGSEELRQLPNHTYMQLKSFCQAKKITQPDFIKQKWPPPQTIMRTRTGLSSWFETAEGGHRLLFARYQYGKQGQMVLVQDAAGTKFNLGQAAIIFHNPVGQHSQKIDGVLYVKHKWQVWDPFGTAPSNSLWVWRVMQSDTNASHKQIESTPMKSKFIIQNQVNMRSNSVSLQGSQNSPMSKGEDAINAMRCLKRSAPPDNSSHSTKRPRSSTSTIDVSLLKKNYPITGPCGATRDRATGEILLRRKKDGKLVMLQCPYCSRKNYETQQGLGNHLRMTHDLPQPNHDQVVKICGIVVDEPERLKPRNISPDRDNENDDDELATAPVVTRSSKRRHTTNESAKFEDEHLVSQFTFKKSLDDRNPRVRSISDINSAEKLFVNALVAGVARKDTMMLTIAVGNREPFHIVRDDKLDFERVLKEIRKVGDGVNVAVSVEDLYL